jgi:hypothetical protein
MRGRNARNLASASAYKPISFRFFSRNPLKPLESGYLKNEMTGETGFAKAVKGLVRRRFRPARAVRRYVGA